MIILPSRGRPHLLKRFFDAGEPQAPGVVVLDDDDYTNYEGVTLPENWIKLVLPRVSIGNAINEVVRTWGWPVYGIMNDDALPMTPSWDAMLEDGALRRGIVWPDDGWEHKSTFPFVRGDIIKGLGWYAWPGLKHLYIDTVWGDLAAAVGIDGYMPEVVIKHMHAMNGGVDDETYRGRIDTGDQTAYSDFTLNHKRDYVERLRHAF